MINNNMFEKSGVTFFRRVLDVASKAQKATASNIVNVNTPGYGAKEVDFIDEMRRSIAGQNSTQIKGTNPRHIPSTTPEKIVRVKEIGGDEESSGTNNVDIEREMGDLAENQMIYEFGAKKLARTFASLRMAIRGKSQ